MAKRHFFFVNRLRPPQIARFSLPTDKSLRRGGRFSQAERNFGLSVLSLCGRLPDTDRENQCGPQNNVTFDKLMRDFAGQPIPFAMELFL